MQLLTVEPTTTNHPRPVRLPAWARIVREPASLYELHQVAKRGAQITTPAAVYDFIRDRAQQQETECFYVLTLNTKNTLTDCVEVSRGSLNASIVEPRETFRIAIVNGAAAVILVHNHPSGDPTPSAEDVAITKRLVKAGEVLGIAVWDHVIIGLPSPDRPAGYCSLREIGLI